MRFGTKIDHKKFYLLSLLSTLSCLLFAKNLMEIIAIIAMYFATLTYLGMFSYSVHIMVKNRVEKFSSGKNLIVIMVIGKLIVLISALIAGVHLMGSRIIIPLLNYIVHILLLGVASKDGH